MWVRGLKLVFRDKPSFAMKSHPMWVRGLKLENVCVTKAAWASRTPCGCVD